MSHMLQNLILSTEKKKVDYFRLKISTGSAQSKEARQYFPLQRLVSVEKSCTRSSTRHRLSGYLLQ